MLNTFPKGLQNSTQDLCYRNAALILFFHTPALLNWAEDFVANYCKRQPAHEQGLCVICMFHQLANMFWAPDPDTRRDDRDFMSRVTKLWEFTIPQEWKNGGQQDVREYMEYVLQSFDQEATKG